MSTFFINMEKNLNVIVYISDVSLHKTIFFSEINWLFYRLLDLTGNNVSVIQKNAFMFVTFDYL